MSKVLMIPASEEERILILEALEEKTEAEYCAIQQNPKHSKETVEKLEALYEKI